MNIMKYYYGNSVKEALGNDPITINSTKVLRQYEENYDVVIPEDEVEKEYPNEEFFEGDEGDLDAEDWIEDMGLDEDDYEMEWDYERKGYVVYYRDSEECDNEEEEE